jgi:3-oxoacyl-[acyl-carrier protein] reductase
MSQPQRIAVVTGAAGGLGRAIAQRLLHDGLLVAAWDVSASALDDMASAMATPVSDGTLLPVRCDVGDAGSVHEAMAATLAWRGALDVLVNNAGISGPAVPLADYPPEQWNAVLRVNLTGTFFCARQAIAPLMASPAGRMVNVASVAGKLASPDICAYAASKAGVIALTKGLARELAGSPVRVNCVTPGAIQTAIFERWPATYVQGLVAKIPLGRFGLPEELAAMVSWLAGAECSFSTGAVFDLSGGRADC